MSIILDEAQAYENSRDYDCCQIIEEDYTVGDAVYKAYCDGRKAPVTDVEIEAAAKYLKANPGLFGPSACFIDRTVSRKSREVCSKPPETQSERTWNELSHFFGWDRPDVPGHRGRGRVRQTAFSGAERKRGEGIRRETGLVIFTAKSRAKIED